MILRLIISILMLGMAAGCSKDKNYRWIIYAGAKSTPAYEQIELGKKVGSFAVFGHGERGEDEWGTLDVQYDNGDKTKFTKGGCVTYVPINSKLLRLQGEAKVPLFVYLVRAEMDSSLNPVEGTIHKKWKVAKGSFSIDPNK